MKVLIGGGPSKFFHLKEFTDALSKINVDVRLVIDKDVKDGFPSRKISGWFQSRKKFQNLIADFKPDLVLIDRPSHFGLAAIEEGLPLFMHLRGDYWSEIQWAKETAKDPIKRAVVDFKDKIGNKCFENSTAIIPLCKYLEKIVKTHYPNKKTYILQSGITSSRWYPANGMKLKHPCVGLLQGATIWGKTKELLTLKKVLENLPNVMFYWAGDGPYTQEILDKLQKYPNFKWLGQLDYPEKVRQFLSEIDVYALISGIDMSPLTLQEAQLMEKPVIATNVAGIPELMENEKSGLLVEKGNSDEIVKKISYFLENQKESKQMGSYGKSFIKENFSWEKIADGFVKKVKLELNLD